MKALSVKQPWANMIAEAWKTIESRTWSTSYRGPLLIVSSKKPDLESAPTMDISQSGPYGYALAVVQLVGCRPMRSGDEDKAGCHCYPGAWAWHLKTIRRVKPFPVRGRLRLFDVYIDENQLEILP